MEKYLQKAKEDARIAQKFSMEKARYLQVEVANRKNSDDEIVHSRQDDEVLQRSTSLKKVKTNQITHIYSSEEKNRKYHNHSFVEYLKEKIKMLKKQLSNTKLFLSMVIHELRNPAQTIELALKEALQLLEQQQQEHNEFMNYMKKRLNKEMMASSSPAPSYFNFGWKQNEEMIFESQNFNRKQSSFVERNGGHLPNINASNLHLNLDKVKQNASFASDNCYAENNMFLKSPFGNKQDLGVIKEEAPSPVRKLRSNYNFPKTSTEELDELENQPMSTRTHHNVPFVQEPKSNNRVLYENQEMNSRQQNQIRCHTSNFNDRSGEMCEILDLDQQQNCFTNNNLESELPIHQDIKQKKKNSKKGTQKNLIIHCPIPEQDPTSQLKSTQGIMPLIRELSQFEEESNNRFSVIQQRILVSSQSSFMLTTLINDLLDLAKVDASAFQMHSNYFNLIDLIQRTIINTRFFADQRDITVESKFDKEDMDHFIEVFGDENRYQQILVNFISNSLKFTPRQGKIQIELVLEQVQKQKSVQQDIQNKRQPSFSKSRHLRSKSIQFQPKEDSKDEAIYSYINFEIRIKDNGVGISPENIKKLFTNFSRLEEHENMNHKGTGLGLSISKSLIEMMGGSVEVQSELNVGTTFIIRMGTKSRHSKTDQQASVNRKMEEENIVHNNISLRQKPKSPMKDRLNSNLVLHSSSRYFEESKHESNFDCSSNIIHRDYHNNNPLSRFSNNNLKAAGPSLSPQPQRNNFPGNEVLIRCLIANDEPFQLFAMNTLLSKYQIEVDIAENGLEAFNKAMQNTYDVILLDLNMPIMDGVEACKKIRKEFQDSCLALVNKNVSGIDDSFVKERPFMIAISAHVSDQCILNLKNSGFDMVIESPLTTDFVKETILKRFSDGSHIMQMIVEGNNSQGPMQQSYEE